MLKRKFIGMYEIRRMSQSDIANITDVHIKSFPGFFLTFMGKCFLSELYLGIVGDLQELLLYMSKKTVF